MAGKRKREARENGTAPGQKKVKNEDFLVKRPFVEAPTGDERRREATLYDLLASEDENERISAADCIISSLIGEEKVSDSVIQRHLEHRLFRGLASGRNAARLGFSLVLTELFTQLFGEPALAATHYPGLSFEGAVRVLMDKTQPGGTILGQEVRDHYLGQLFGIECFVGSGVIFAEPARWTMVLDLLLKLAQKKVWLRSQCSWVIVQALQQMDQKSAVATLEHIAEANLAKTADGVAIWITAMEKYPGIKVKPWKHPLATKTLGELASILKESFNDKREDAPKQANWTAQLHFVWDIILDYYARNIKTDEFDQFWDVVVDSFFSKNASEGQKFKGFMVFQRMLEKLADEKKIDLLFSKNLMSCLMNQAAKEDRYLHRAAVKALKAIENTATSHPKSLIRILRSLLRCAYNFDQRTSFKTIDCLLQNSGAISEKKVLEVLQIPIATLGTEDEAVAKSTLRCYVDYLSKCFNASIEKTTKQSNGQYLQELSRLAYSHPKDVPSVLLTEQIRELCRSKLESSFSKLTRNADDFSDLCHVIAAIDPSLVEMDEDIRAAVNDAIERMHSLLKRKSKSEAVKSVNEALAALHAISVFLLYNGDPDAMESLKDLAQYSEKLKQGKTEGSELLVEILLSMVARPSSLMRQTSQQVFEALSSHITAGGLQLLTDPLASSESAQGQKELFNTEDDVDEAGEGSDDASDSELDSDVELVDPNELDPTSDGQGPGSPEEAIDLEDLCANILKSHRLDKDMDAESSDSDGDMSDSQMMQLDDKLAEVFKQRVKAKPDSKKEKKEAKQSVVQFKRRILDLVDTYVRAEGQRLNPLAYGLLIPLLHLMRTTKTKPLASRACEIIINYQKVLKKARGGGGSGGGSSSSKATADVGAGNDGDDLLALLVQIHDAAGRDNAHVYSKAVSAASLVVAGSLFAADRDSIKQIAAVYAKTQGQWVLGEAQVQASFFADWNNWCQNHAAQARAVSGKK